jgi:predicted GNAT family acetyltransferase
LKAEGSEEKIKILIKYNISLGLFNESNELVAWIIQIDTGSLAILQVDENYLRKGYGEIVTRAMIKKIATEFEIDVTTNVEETNEISTALFAKLNFRDIGKSYWMIVAKK